MKPKFGWTSDASFTGGGFSNAGDEIISPQSSSTCGRDSFSGGSRTFSLLECFPNFVALPAASLGRWAEDGLETTEGPPDARGLLDEESLITFGGEDKLPKA